MRAIAVLAVMLAGCGIDIDEPWQLDHDRIIAARATPPRIPAGGRSELDALLGKVGAAPSVEVPLAAMVVSPESLASALRFDAGKWVVTAPDEARLAAVRTELGLAAGAPVPLVVGIAFPGTFWPSGEVGDGFAATKTVWLGDAADNPVIAGAEVNGVTADASPELVVGKLVDVPLSVQFADEDDINWLTSCGTMHDFDLPQAYLRVEDEDPTEGHLAVVVRLANGGVGWRVWPIRAE